MCGLLDDHVVVGVVEGVAPHHPHEAGVDQGLVRGAAQGLGGGLHAGHHPEGLGGRDGERAVWTWGGEMDY